MMTSSRGNIKGLMVFGLLLMVGAALLGLVSLGGLETAKTPIVLSQRTTSGWIEGQNALVRGNLTIRSHATKHSTDAWDIYSNLMAGKCTASMTYCGASNIERLHVCVDPITGIVGGVLQFGNEITTGFYEGNVGYWERRVQREGWEVCR